MKVSSTPAISGDSWKAVVKMSTLRLIMLISKVLRFVHDLMVRKMARASVLEV